MGFTTEQKTSFVTFLKTIDKKVVTRLPMREAGEFFSILIDYSVDDSAFELKIAQLFYRIPDKFNELKDSIKDISVVRNAMLGEGGNAQEARDLTIDFFDDRIDDLMELAGYEQAAEEDELNILEKKRRQESKAEKRRMEKELQKLQEEQQQIFEIEKDERKKRKEEKKGEEEKVKEVRQAEFETAAEERRERREKIEAQINAIKDTLQVQHDHEIEERKE